MEIKAKGLIMSPTRRGIRSDPAGDGHYHASRGTRLHQGLDFICEPGQRVYSPIHNAKFVRLADPYGDGKYSGALLRNAHMEVLIFYVSIDEFDIKDSTLYHSSIIGTAQDITERYSDPAMLPHVHLQIDSVDPVFFYKEED